MEEKKSIHGRAGNRFSVFELDKIITALLNNTDNRRFVQNVRQLFIDVDPMDFAIKEPTKSTCVFLIGKITDAILSKNDALPRDALLSTLDLSGRYADAAQAELITIEEQTVSESELRELDKKISNELRYNVIAAKTDALSQQLSDIKSQNYDDLGTALASVETTVSGIDYDFKHSREAVDENRNMVCLDPSSLSGRLDSIVQRMKNKSNTVATGIHLFNKILDGGYKAGRLYVALGLAKAGKSKFLVESSIWARKYNTLAAKDQTKKPVILYITMENGADETVVRLMNYAEGNDYKITEHTPEENMHALADAGLVDEADGSDSIDAEGIEAKPEIIIQYKPDHSITVTDIKIMLDELKKQGKECVFLVIDYLKRLRAIHPDRNGMLRFDLGEITNDLHTLAIDEDLPILTAMQLNRTANSELDDATTFIDKLTAFSHIGGSNVGESIDIIQNADFVFAINPAEDKKPMADGNGYEYCDDFMLFNVIASRMRQGSNITLFAHPYMPGNDMRLIEDFADDDMNEKSMSFDSLMSKKLTEAAPGAARKYGSYGRID